MEAQTDIQTYLDKGKQGLAQGEAREAAIAYAHGAQLEPDNAMVHLGLAEANLALANYGVVYMACSRVQKLRPTTSVESLTAQALLDLLDRRYDRALQNIDAAIAIDPGVAYAHAMRSYLLRVLKQDYDANLARARAARLSYGAHFENCFPPVEQSYAAGYTATSTPLNNEQTDTPTLEASPRAENEPIPTWSRPNGMQRQMVRTRFALSRYPNIVTIALILLNVIIFGISFLYPQLTEYGAQINPLVEQGQYWRIFTAMFLHLSILHVGFNMLSLYFVGSAVETFMGKWRYLAIYFLSGIAGGILFLFTSSGGAAVGASGAIFGVFGALGVFYIVNRQALGAYGRGAISNWLFWIGLNLVIGLQPGSGIALTDHIGGLIIGMILAFLLVPRLGRRRI